MENKKKYLVELTAIAFLLHSLEEYFTGFHNADASVGWGANLFGISNLIFWLLVQVVVYILLIHFWKTAGTASKVFGWIIFVIIVFELSHPIHALLQGRYASGFITSLAFPILTYYWFRFLKLSR